jgi:hypothetical protein
VGVVVDTDLVKRVVAVSGERTMKAAVTKALEEFIAIRKGEKQRAALNSAHQGTASSRRGSRRRK